jgi:hypothetical protein
MVTKKQVGSLASRRKLSPPSCPGQSRSLLSFLQELEKACFLEAEMAILLDLEILLLSFNTSSFVFQRLP